MLHSVGLLQKSQIVSLAKNVCQQKKRSSLFSLIIDGKEKKLTLVLDVSCNLYCGPGANAIKLSTVVIHNLSQ